MSLTIVSDHEAALRARQLAMKQNTGVYYIQMDMMRGYNLKLTADARVIICDTVGSLNLTQVEQMAGRASRSQNIQRCGVHLVE